MMMMTREEFVKSKLAAIPGSYRSRATLCYVRTMAEQEYDEAKFYSGSLNRVFW